MKKIFTIATWWLLLVAWTAASAQEFGPWSAPVSLGPTVNSACDDMHPTLSKDGLSFIFSSTRPTIAGAPCLPALHLWVSQRDTLDDAWQTPQPLTGVNSPYNSKYQDHAPYLTTDGHWLFFHSSRPGGCNGGVNQELWATHRKDKRDDFGWEAPINLGCTLNIAGADDAGPNAWEDDSTGTLYLYFTRNLTPANANGFNIYLSTCTADLSSCIQQQLWSPGEYVAELSSPGFRNTRTAIRRRDGLEMFVTSNRPGSVGLLDVWVSSRASAQDLWSIPIDLNQDNANKGGDAQINTTVNDGAPALSWDGQTMILYSNRSGGSGGNDLYMSTRQKLTNPQ
jgi:WD40 repeat protein